MPQESINLIIGALIGFIPTLLITWFNHRNQVKKDRQARTWQMEDLFFKRKSEFLERRLTQVEDFFSKAIIIVGRISEFVMSDNRDPLFSMPADLESDKIFLRENNRLILGVCNALQDAEISKYANALILEIEHVIQIYDAVGQIYLSGVNHRMDDLFELRKRMSKMRQESTTLFSKLIHTMDSWRNHLRPDREDIDNYDI